MSNILDDHIEETFQNKLDSVEVIRRNMEVGYQKMMQFRIKSITLLRHFVLGNIHLDLWHENDNADSDIYSTVIIGVNGIGKSHMLRAIADIFCYLEQLRENPETLKNPPRFKFKVEYSLFGNLYEFANFGEVETVGRH